MISWCGTKSTLITNACALQPGTSKQLCKDSIKYAARYEVCFAGWVTEKDRVPAACRSNTVSLSAWDMHT